MFLQIIKNSKLACVQSSATSVMGSTPNVKIMLIQGRPSPSAYEAFPLFQKKTCYKKSRKNFSSSSAKISDDLFLVIDRIPGCKFPIRGHPFMTSTRRGVRPRRGSGSGGRMWTEGRGSSPMWTSTQKIEIRVH